jgi:hypothetical protein
MTEQPRLLPRSAVGDLPLYEGLTPKRLNEIAVNLADDDDDEEDFEGDDEDDDEEDDDMDDEDFEDEDEDVDPDGVI